jgi:hypothetical protein
MRAHDNHHAQATNAMCTDCLQVFLTQPKYR